MPYTCCVVGCSNRAHPGDNKQFFGFPLKNDELLKRWIIATKRENFTPTKFMKICSDHFVSSDYLKRPGSYIKHLKPDAIPSVFPSHLQKSSNCRHPMKRNADRIVSDTTDVPSTFQNTTEISTQNASPKQTNSSVGKVTVKRIKLLQPGGNAETAENAEIVINKEPVTSNMIRHMPKNKQDENKTKENTYYLIPDPSEIGEKLEKIDDIVKEMEMELAKYEVEEKRNNTIYESDSHKEIISLKNENDLLKKDVAKLSLKVVSLEKEIVNRRLKSKLLSGYSPRGLRIMVNSRQLPVEPTPVACNEDDSTICVIEDDG